MSTSDSERSSTSGYGHSSESSSQDAFSSNTSSEGYRRYTTTSEAYVHEVYGKILKEDAVERFLQETDLFDSGARKWAIPGRLVNKGELRQPVMRILESIVKTFVQPAAVGVVREVVDVYRDQWPTEDDDQAALFPPLVIRATGPSFEAPVAHNATPLDTLTGFSNMASCVDLMLEWDMEQLPLEMLVEDQSKYARGIFAAQPNRKYVRILLVTEKSARILQYDRAGVEVTPSIDIHQRPADFVRVVVALGHTHEPLLGLDDSVQWTIINGKKQGGTITTVNAEQQRLRYPLVASRPFIRTSLYGRGTTCWRVLDPLTQEELIIKDSWRTDDRPAEHEFLTHARGLAGVCQMTSFEPGGDEIQDFRCPTTRGQYQNRISTRIVMKAHGKPVDSFASISQLLAAIRDAIAGKSHQRLLNSKHRILHRDISHNNILLGDPGAPQGYRGILIDFDLAVYVSSATSVLADWKMGTRLFQSCAVLQSRLMPRNSTPLHDYIDDLQSFFFLLCFLLLVYRPDGSRRHQDEKGPALIKMWADDEPSTSFYAKQLFLTDGRTKYIAQTLIEETWGLVIRDLFTKFFDWMCNLTDQKDKIVLEQFNYDPSTLEPLLSKSSDHYSHVLKFFDDALGQIESSRATLSEQPVGTASSAASPPQSLPVCHSTAPSQRKRRSEEAEHPESRQPKSKRLNGEACAVDAAEQAVNPPTLS